MSEHFNHALEIHAIYWPGIKIVDAEYCAHRTCLLNDGRTVKRERSIRRPMTILPSHSTHAWALSRSAPFFATPMRNSDEWPNQSRSTSIANAWVRQLAAGT